MEYVVFGWLGALILFIIIEIATVNLTTVWFAGGALVALIFNICKLPLVAQVIAFFVVTLLMLVLFRPLLEKAINGNHEKTNVDSLIGQKANVIEAINNFNATGAVTLNGQEWTARTDDDTRTIEVGEVVEVVSVAGVKLIVK